MTKNIEHKSFPVTITKVDREKGIVDAIVSVMGNLDYGNDIIHNGAFTKTISERASKIRVLDNHNTNSTTDVIGKPIYIREIGRDELPIETKNKYPNASGGLLTSTQFDMDDDNAKKIFNKLANGFIDEWSIGFSIPRGKVDHTTENIDGKDTIVRNIREVILFEFSPVIFAMNDATSTVGVKANEKQRSLMQTYISIAEQFEASYLDREMWAGYIVNDVYDDGTMIARAINIESDYVYYKLNWYFQGGDEYTFDPMETWQGGNFAFVAGLKSNDEIEETKAGRVLSQANYDKISKAHTLLMEVVESATPQEEMSEDVLDEEKNNDYDIMDNNSNEEPNDLADPDNTPVTNEVDRQALLSELDKLIEFNGD